MAEFNRRINATNRRRETFGFQCFPRDPQTFVRHLASSKIVLSRRNFLNKVKTNVCLADFRALENRYCAQIEREKPQVISRRGGRSSFKFLLRLCLCSPRTTKTEKERV